nr:MAG TPA: hypothetical protein [Caudoviricetes sp.]
MNTVLLTFKRCLFFVCVSGNFPFSFFLLPGRTFRFRFSKTVFSFFGLYISLTFIVLTIIKIQNNNRKTNIRS